MRRRILKALENGNCIPQAVCDYVNFNFEEITIEKRGVNNYLLSMYELGQLTRKEDPTYRGGTGRLMYFIKKKRDMPKVRIVI